ncbi:Putative cytochrome c [hydrothermal vent metagenome]|uniref:Cytochrome c n=1 Tax=hydrothermal vent metagenome TaxID=652676 RepID=A0A3B1BHA0_9ZZZZ
MNTKWSKAPFAVLIMLSFVVTFATANEGLAQQGDKAAPAAAVAKPKQATKGVMFNRLMKRTKSNLPPDQDGIHDPENEGTYMLQPPKEAFQGMPRAMTGNKVDWVKMMSDGLISPRADRLDPNAEQEIFEFDVIREVRGSMPDVMFPHDKHTAWLACENCHDDIFIPQVGANQLSMALILTGQKCGVCHGKVAFPVTECRKCHSVKKDTMTKKGAVNK